LFLSAGPLATLARIRWPLTGLRGVAARVAAILVGSREHSDPAYRHPLNCDTWEVLLPAPVFEPE